MKNELRGKTLYTAQILNSDMTSPNFVSKKVYDEFKSCKNRHKFFKKEDIKAAVDGLKEEILSLGKSKTETIVMNSELQSMGCNTKVKRTEMRMFDAEIFIELIDEAFPDVVEKKNS